MYALIYDEHDLTKPEKEVISSHNTREKAQKALEKRMKKLGKRVWECNTRIVWVEGRVRPGEYITADTFEVWAPDEELPESEKVPDGD